MNYLYPIFIRLEGKSCLVVGGGKVAARKVKSLLQAKAKVTVVSPKLNEDLQDMAKAGWISYLARSYENEDLNGVVLVIAATDDRETNQRISREAERRNILVNVVDEPDLGNFYVPSIYHQGDLKIAISTNGKVPALARLIREKLQELFPPKIAQDIEQLEKLRDENKALFPHDPNSRKAQAIEQARRVLNSYFNRM